MTRRGLTNMMPGILLKYSPRKRVALPYSKHDIRKHDAEHGISARMRHWMPPGPATHSFVSYVQLTKSDQCNAPKVCIYVSFERKLVYVLHADIF